MYVLLILFVLINQIDHKGGAKNTGWQSSHCLLIFITQKLIVSSGYGSLAEPLQKNKGKSNETQPLDAYDDSFINRCSG
jgi:hypothetical protein